MSMNLNEGLRWGFTEIETSDDLDIEPLVLKEKYYHIRDDEGSAVNHPSHYQSSNGIECRDAIAAATENLTGLEAFDTGCIIKYAWRWKKKNGVEDLRKIIAYTEELIRNLEDEDE